MYPGKWLVLASAFWPTRELITLDLPTLERPMKAIWGVPSLKVSSGPTRVFRKVAEVIFIVKTSLPKPRDKGYFNECRYRKKYPRLQFYWRLRLPPFYYTGAKNRRLGVRP